jgi:protein-tyrosine phosphatase
MSLSGLCDLHCHYVPAVDDGVKSAREGRELCAGLRSLGFSTVIATPHIRPGMFDNRRPQLMAAYDAFVAESADDASLPETGLAAEHFCDDTFFELLERGDALPYPGGHAALIEFSTERLPLGLASQLFRMQVRGVRPVIAHPERYKPIWRSSQELQDLIDRGGLALLDLMALVGKYGRQPRKAAEQLLDAGLYYAACSDSHKPGDLEQVAEGLARLVELVGEAEAQRLLSEHPRAILSGEVQD